MKVRRAHALVAISIAAMLAASPVNAQQMAITFDDLPAHGDRPPGETRLAIAQSILKTLRAEKMPPVYGFINAHKIQEDPSTLAVLKAWRSAREPLGSHTYTHSNLDEESAEIFETDIAKNEPLLKNLMAGADWHWFRYPYLDEGDTLDKRHAIRAYLAEHGYRIAEVSMDFEDYLWNAPYARCVAAHNQPGIAYLQTSYLDTADQYLTLFRGLSKTLYGREISYVLLLHVGAFDAHMLPELLDLYRHRGMTFISLPAAEEDAAYSTDPDVAIKSSGTLQEQMVLAKKLKFPPNSKPYKKLEALCQPSGKSGD